MADCEFAKNQMIKYGWVNGSGLGKDEQGMKNPIKVSIKNNKKGVGHDPGKEFSSSCWVKMFNKAANSIIVDNSEDGVDVRKVKTDKETTVKKTLLYGNFIKTSTLTNTSDGCEEVAHHTEKSPESEEEDDLKSKKYVIPTDEEMFLKCGGRTAHKGARHGLKLNGKLKRIEEHEAQLLKEMQQKLLAKEAKGEDTSKAKKKKKKKDRTDNCDSPEDNKLICDNNEIDIDKNCDNNEIHTDSNCDNFVKSKKKKKHNKSEKLKINARCENVRDVEIDSDHEEVPKKKKKRSKRDNVENNNNTDCVVTMSNSKKKNKRKKRDDNEHVKVHCTSD